MTEIHRYYKNLKVKEAPYGFGWHEDDNPSTDCIGNIMERLDERVGEMNETIKTQAEIIKEYELLNSICESEAIARNDIKEQIQKLKEELGGS